eukprot:gene5759-5999_t
MAELEDRAAELAQRQERLVSDLAASSSSINHALVTERNKLASDMELAEVKAAADLEVRAKLLEAAQADLARRQAAVVEREAAAKAAEEAARATTAAAKDSAAAHASAVADADRAMAGQRQQLQQLQMELSAQEAHLSSHQAQLQSWQAQLEQQQATLEQLEASAADALAEAREAAAAALAERDQALAAAEAARQQLVLLDAEAEGARIRGDAEVQAAQAARSSVAREAAALAEQKAAVTATVSQLEQREESLVQAEAELEGLRMELDQQQADLARRAAALAVAAKEGAAQAAWIEAEKEAAKKSELKAAELAAKEARVSAQADALTAQQRHAAELEVSRSHMRASVDAEQQRLLGLVSSQAAALADKERQLETLRLELASALAAGSADLDGRERSLREAEQRLQQQQVDLRSIQARAAQLSKREMDVETSQSKLEAAAAAVNRERHALARERAQLQEQDLRMAEARQRLEIEQAAAAAASAATSANGSLVSGLGRPGSAVPGLGLEPSEGALSLSAPVTLNDKQHKTAAALLASLGQTAARGRDRLGRLERVLNTIAADAAEPNKVQAAYAAVSQLSRELLELQQSHAEFESALEVVGTRGELAEVKRQLERHQALLAQWEEKVAGQLEYISDLQSPTKRNSMLAAAASSSGLAQRAASVTGASRGMRVSTSGEAGGSLVGGQQHLVPGISVEQAPFQQHQKQQQQRGAVGNDLQLGLQHASIDSKVSGSFASMLGGRSSSALPPTAAPRVGYHANGGSTSGSVGASFVTSLVGSSSLSGAGGMMGAASAPSSPVLWRAGSSPSSADGGHLSGAAGSPGRRVAFTPGPALTGMGDSTPPAH